MYSTVHVFSVDCTLTGFPGRLGLGLGFPGRLGVELGLGLGLVIPPWRPDNVYRTAFEDKEFFNINSALKAFVSFTMYCTVHVTKQSGILNIIRPPREVSLTLTLNPPKNVLKIKCPLGSVRKKSL